MSETTDLPYPIQRAMQEQRRRVRWMFDGVEHPIEREVRDTDEIQGFFREKKYVPFAGTITESGHRLLNLYDLVRRFSPTHGACIAKKSAFAFGTTATTIRMLDPEFDTGATVTPPTPREKEMYREALKNVAFDRPLKEFFRGLAGDYQATGNAWMQVNMTGVEGQFSASLKIHPVENVLYVATGPNEPKLVGVSPFWTSNNLTFKEMKPPEILPVWPNYELIDGVYKTMMHLKAGGFDWYGRPQCEAGILSMYEEVQNEVYRVQATDTDFSGRLIIETETPAPAADAYADDKAAQDAGYMDWASEFKDNWTNAGKNRKGVLVGSRPTGTAPMFVFAVPPNTNGGYFTDIKRINTADILAAHGVTGRFMGQEVSGRYAQNSAFLEDYILNVQPTIDQLRHTVCVFMNQALTDFWNFSGRAELNEQSLWFNGPIDKDIEMFRSMQDGATQQNNPNPNIDLV